MQARPSETFAAEIALRLSGKEEQANPRPVRKQGLFTAEGAEPLFVTWLVARAGAASGRGISEAAQNRMATFAPRLGAGDLTAAGAYVTGRDLLQLLRVSAPSLAPVAAACGHAADALTGKDLIAASTWVEIASVSHVPCPASVVAGVVDLAHERLNSTVVAPGPYTAAELWAGARALRTAAQPVVVPPICPALLAERQTARIARDTMTYLACSDAIIASGARPQLSQDVATSLDTVVRTSGRLAEQQTLDSMGKLYETQTLRLLHFPEEVLVGSRAGVSAPKPGRVDRDPLSAFVQGRLPSPELPVGASSSDVVLAAASVLGGAACPRHARKELTAENVAAGPDVDALFREAVAAKAAERCGGNSSGWQRSVLKRLGAVEPLLADDLIGRWKAAESRCVLGARPTLTQQNALRLLPDYSLDNPKFDLSLDTLYASVRLSEIVDKGCARPFWDVSNE